MLLGLMMYRYVIAGQHLHLLTCTLRVAARGRDATEQNLLRLLIGRHVRGTHRCHAPSAALTNRMI